VGGGRRHELTVSTYQMAALVLFNDAGAAARGIPFGALVDALGVPRDELARHVLSLLNPKFRILNKASKGRDLVDADVLTVNGDISSKLVRVKVPLISAASAGGAAAAAAAAAAEEMGSDIAALIELQRKSMTEAAIVRILKARKSIDHANLVAEVTRQLSVRFRAQPAEIKKRVEDLIDRDYIERDATDRQLYTCERAARAAETRPASRAPPHSPRAPPAPVASSPPRRRRVSARGAPDTIGCCNAPRRPRRARRAPSRTRAA